ncbi:sugar transporter ST2, partial [Toxoplasma gondii p89]
TFGLFAFLNFLALLFVIFVVPEGKGRSLEDVQRNQMSLKSLSRGPGCPQVGAPQKAKDTEE